MNFADQLARAVTAKRTPLMVGLDPRAENLPAPLRAKLSAEPHSPTGRAQLAELFEVFCREIIDVVAPRVAIVKPQMAFFEELGPAGMQALHRTIQYAQNAGLLVALDGKRNDIGSTAAAYAAAYLGRGERSAWGGDALTVNAWLGADGLAPFVEAALRTDSGVFALVKTSNPGSRDYQDQRVGDRPLYEIVGRDIEQAALASLGQCGYGAVGAVVGATYPRQLAELRQAMPHTWFLIPGFGAQGGSAADVAGGFDSQGLGAVVNSSRGIIFAYQQDAYRPADGAAWQTSVERAMVDSIAALAEGTPAGQLQK